MWWLRLMMRFEADSENKGLRGPLPGVRKPRVADVLDEPLKRPMMKLGVIRQLDRGLLRHYRLNLLDQDL